MLVIITLVLVLLLNVNTEQDIETNNIPNEEVVGFCGNAESSYPAVDNLFKNNCAACHAYDKRVTGPALRGSLERWETEERLIGYITNEDSMIAIKDPYTLEIINFDSSNSSHSRFDFTKEEIKLIVDMCSN